jgi:hypothetical protein
MGGVWGGGTLTLAGRIKAWLACLLFGHRWVFIRQDGDWLNGGRITSRCARCRRELTAQASR